VARSGTAGVRERRCLRARPQLARRAGGRCRGPTPARGMAGPLRRPNAPDTCHAARPGYGRPLSHRGAVCGREGQHTVRAARCGYGWRAGGRAPTELPQSAVDRCYPLAAPLEGGQGSAGPVRRPDAAGARPTLPAQGAGAAVATWRCLGRGGPSPVRVPRCTYGWRARGYRRQLRAARAGCGRPLSPARRALAGGRERCSGALFKRRAGAPFGRRRGVPRLRGVGWAVNADGVL
jgi:hypothetical protein